MEVRTSIYMIVDILGVTGPWLLDCFYLVMWANLTINWLGAYGFIHIYMENVFKKDFSELLAGGFGKAFVKSK